jgi:NADPH-dependent FMN reductase
LKNAIDWASRPYGDSAWNGKPAAVIGASIGAIGTARAQYHLRQVFVFLNMFPINQPEVMIGHAAQRFDAEGNLTDDATKEFIRKLLQNPRGSDAAATEVLGAIQDHESTSFNHRWCGRLRGARRKAFRSHWYFCGEFSPDTTSIIL